MKDIRHAVPVRDRRRPAIRRLRAFAGGAVAGVLLAVMGGCSDILDIDAGDVYVLMSVNDEPLPAILVISQFETRRLIADTIRFEGTDRFTRVRWTSTDPRRSGEETLDRELSTGKVIRVDGGFALVDDICADPNSLALCIEPDAARTSGRTLILSGSIPPAGVKRFERIGS